MDPRTGEPHGSRAGALSELARFLGVEAEEIKGMTKTADTDAGPEFSYTHEGTKLRIRPLKLWMLGVPRSYQVWRGDRVVRSVSVPDA